MNDEEHHNPGGVFVKVTECRDRHGKIELALFGPDGRGGIVNDIATIKTDVKHRWTPKDYATLLMAIAALITALAAILKG